MYDHKRKKGFAEFTVKKFKEKNGLDAEFFYDERGDINFTLRKEGKVVGYFCLGDPERPDFEYWSMTVHNAEGKYTYRKVKLNLDDAIQVALESLGII